MESSTAETRTVASTTASSAPDFVIAIARALHRPGMACHHLESLLGRVTARLGLDSQMLSLPTAFLLSGVEAAYQMAVVAVAIVTGLLLGNLHLPSRRQ